MFRFRRLGLALACLSALAACATKQPFADDAAIAAVSYRDAPYTAITLYTMVNNRTGSGGHSAIRIDASESIIFDPAGSFEADIVPERNDVLFGISPRVEQAYRSAHARSTFHVVSQTVRVTPEQAEVAYRLALSKGAVPGAFCANATSGILRQVPGFESIRSTFYPTNLQKQFSQIPGVVTDKYYEGDSEELKAGIAESNATLNNE
ncbi:MAG: hypothetical protein AB3N13_15685 [Arenibacterium sp.]